MARYNDEWSPIEVKDAPDVLRLAEKVRDEDKPILLERDGEALAVVVPVEWAKRLGLRAPRTEADYAAFRAAAGSWKDVDTDQLLEDIYAARGRPAHPPVEQ